MKVIGANICYRPSGKMLRDAGACLIENGKIIIAIAEERITRIKHDGTINNSIMYCLNSSNYDFEDIDYYVFSVCGAKPLSKQFIKSYLYKNGIDIPIEKIIVSPSHHLSHASSAYFCSGFERSIIVVADRDGSIINGDEHLVFANSVEHLSYYIGDGCKIDLIERDEDMVGDLGLGQGYSYVTEWLGFDEHSMAGKTMAMASYGSPGVFGNAHFFVYEGNRIVNKLEPIASHKSLSVRRLILKESGIDIGGRQSTEFSEIAFDVARLVQDDLERVMIAKLAYLKKKTGISNLCFAGGVALNCKLNYEIYRSGLFEDIFIQPAAGDTGQCLGNALYGYNLMCGKVGEQFKTAYLGKAYSSEEQYSAVLKYSDKVKIVPTKNLFDSVAELLSLGKIIAWFQGRSEFGPRALGNRSILASPTEKNMRDRLNETIKYREWFRPYGVCVIEESVSQFFKFDRKSPYMLFAPQVLDDVHDMIPGAIHVDNSTRIQTVSLDDNEKLYKLLRAFQLRTGVPVLINTSFNLNGQPIVESPCDAIECFLKSNIDYLVINDQILKKTE